MSDRPENIILFSEDLFPLNYLIAQQISNKQELEDLLFWADTLECVNCLFDCHCGNDLCKYNQRRIHQVYS